MRQREGVGTLSPPAALSVLAPVVIAGFLVVLGGVLAVLAFRAASDYLPRLNDPFPAILADPAPMAAAPPRHSQRVVLVIIDGLRLRDSFGHDFLDAVRRLGVDASGRSHYPTISRPNWVSILTGVPPTWSGVRNNWFDFEVIVDSVMDRANEAGLRSAFAADFATSGGRMFPTDFEDIHIARWEGGLRRATQLTLTRNYPLVVILPGAVDEVGHEEGADSDEYRQAIEDTDAMLADALSVLDLSRDTLIITSDHGHTDRGGHGGNELDVLEVPLILAGAGIRQGAAIPAAELSDIAPTIATLLGIPAPRHGFGKTLVSALDLLPETRSAVAQADEARIAHNRGVASRFERNARDQARLARSWRASISIAVVLMTLLVLWAGARIGAAKFDWRVLVFSVPPFPLVYYALVDVFLQHFSLSAITLQEDTTLRLLKLGLISTALQVVAAWIALRGRVVLRNRLAAANGIVLCGFLVALIPAAVMWSLFGAGPFAVPPSSAVSVLVPATFVAAASYTIGAAVTLFVEIIVFFARAIDPRIRLQHIAEAKRERTKRELWDNEPRTDSGAADH